MIDIDINTDFHEDTFPTTLEELAMLIDKKIKDFESLPVSEILKGHIRYQLQHILDRAFKNKLTVKQHYAHVKQAMRETNWGYAEEVPGQLEISINEFPPLEDDDEDL